MKPPGAPAMAGGSRRRRKVISGNTLERSRDEKQPGLGNFGLRVEQSFTLGGPDTQRIFVNDLFVGFQEIDQQTGSKQFKGPDHVRVVGFRTVTAALERLRACQVPEFGLDLWLFQVLP